MLLVACYATVQRRPTIVGFNPARRQEIWNRAVVELQSRGYPLTLLNEASGTISTGQIGVEPFRYGIYTYSVRQSFSLTISPVGRIICNIAREFKPAGVFSALLTSSWVRRSAFGV
jgi:hypothetical protein